MKSQKKWETLFFPNSIKISSPNPKLDRCSCVSEQLFQLSTQTKPKP